jgi:two-component system CheB/CheR fusion protein
MRKSGKSARGQATTPASTSPPSALVAIGAPADGLKRLTSLFAALPTDSGAAFAIALSGGGAASAEETAKVLAEVTTMHVQVGRDGAALQPDSVYVVAPHTATTVVAGRLEAAGDVDGGAVDSLLITAAEAYEESAIVVVLDGLRAEGAAGVAATKRCGGFSLAEPESVPSPAENTVSAAGIADLCVPLERIPREIAAYVGALNRTQQGDAVAEVLDDDIGKQLARIAAILRNGTGHDFHGYKHATFLRRVQRRMQVVQLEEVERYIERLRNDASEVQHLFQDLLIGVTQFFRDPEEFELLEREVIPKLFEGRRPDERIRVWVLGCATGEEAYSLAILLREHMSQLDLSPEVQIFATDIDARALAVARSGRYAESIAKHMSAERLARWFIKEGATYSVSKVLREMCIFSPHNLVRDAPFSRIDLISCRNLLIYLNSELQDRVIPIFHFSLRPGGHLFLGPAENVTRHQKLFAPIDRKARVFRRLDTPTRVLPDFPLSRRAERGEPAAEVQWRPSPTRTLSSRVGQRVTQVAERYAPAYVVVDENHDVLHFSGRTGRFLEPATGAANLNLLNLVHRDLRLDLRGALHKAAGQRTRIEVQNLRQETASEGRVVHVAVEPVETGADEPPIFIVFFQDGGPAAVSAKAAPSGHSNDEHIQRLETDLRATRERLQTTIEELESTNEELKSSNEEYQSINEELQSANEELETSKEELQAVNEELQTVNSELAHRVGELANANSDLKNLLESTQIATIFLDNDLRLRSFTPASSEVFHLIEADVGRPIVHVAARVNYPELQDDARKVLKSLGQVSREVVSSDGERRFIVRVLPYRSVDNFIAGVVVTFLDITGTARAEAALRASERRFGEAQDLAGVGVWEWDTQRDEIWWSPVVFRLWGLPSADQPPPPVGKLPIHPDDRAAYEAATAQAKVTGELNHEWRVAMLDGSVRWLAASGRSDGTTTGRRILGVVHDITERKQTETRLRLLLGELQHRVRNILGVVRSIVVRTVRNARSIDELSDHLEGRLATLARTQGIFTRTGEATVDLEEMVREEILATAANEEQVKIEGPQVSLRHEAAETFALALHELSTNAVKYGALADANGRLSITWRVMNTSKGARLSLQWRESGVRAMAVSPARTGFGRELIERGLPHELGATTSLEFPLGGMQAVIELPLGDKVAVLQDTSIEAGDE